MPEKQQNLWRVGSQGFIILKNGQISLESLRLKGELCQRRISANSSHTLQCPFRQRQSKHRNGPTVIGFQMARKCRKPQQLLRNKPDPAAQCRMPLSQQAHLAA